MIGLSLFSNTAVIVQAQGLKIPQNIPLERAPNLPGPKIPGGIKPIENRPKNVRLVVDEIHAHTTTEKTNFLGIGNTDDELYFTVIGGSSKGIINIPRLSPPPPQDYFSTPPGGTHNNIELIQHQIEQGKSMKAIVTAADQDNAQLPAIVDLAKGTAEALGAIFIDASLSAAAKEDLKNGAIKLFNSIGANGDDPIGGFTVEVINNNNTLKATWTPGAATQMLHSDDTSATFKSNGSKSDYTYRVSIK